MVSDVSPEDGPEVVSRRDRMLREADRHSVPVRAILFTIAAVAGVYLLGQVLYRLRELHRDLFIARGTQPPTMTYFGFQRAIIGALRVKGEAAYPEEEAWIVPAK